MKTALKIIAPVTLTALTLAGCDDDEATGAPISASEAPITASARVEEAAEATADLLTRMRTAAEAAGPHEAQALRFALAAFDELACGQADVEGEIEPCALDAEDLAGAAEAVDALMTQLAEQAILEADTGRQLTYRLSPEMLCASEAVRSPAGEGEAPEIIEGAVDEDCAAMLDQVPIRVVMTAPAEGAVDMILEVGPGRRRPVGISLGQDALSAWVDLGTVGPIIADIGAATGEAVELPFQLSGRVQARFSHSAEGVEAAVESPTGVRLTGAVEDQPVEISVAAGAAFTVGLNADLEARLGYAAGDVLFNVPLEISTWSASLTPEGEIREEDHTLAAHAISLRFGASEAAATLALLTDVITADIDLAPLTVEVDGEQAMALSLGAAGGGATTLSLAPAEGHLDLTASPSLSLSATVHEGLLAMLDDPEVEIEGAEPQDLTVTLGGAEAPRVRLLDGFEDQRLRVMAGTLTLSSSAFDEDLVIEAGMCAAAPMGEAEAGEAEVGEAEAGEIAPLEITACE